MAAKGAPHIHYTVTIFRMQQSLKDIKVEMVKTDAQIRALKYCTTFKDSLTPAESQQQGT